MDQVNANFPCILTVINYFLAVTRDRLTAGCAWLHVSVSGLKDPFNSLLIYKAKTIIVLSPLVGQDIALHSPSFPFSPRSSLHFFFCYCNILNICSIPNVILLCKCYTHLQCTPVSSVQFPKPLKVLRNMTVKLYI